MISATKTNVPPHATEAASVPALTTHVEKESHIPSLAIERLPIQRKLAIGATDDPLEREADHMADHIMRKTEGSLLQKKCSHCEEEENIQRKGHSPFLQRMSDSRTTVASDQVTNQIKSTQGGGKPLGNEARSFMENRFDRDFSNVRIHTGNYASQLNNELNAQAFTVGSDIYFNENKYTTETTEGKHLLAHELTHTIQQGNGLNRKIQRRSHHASITMSGAGITDFPAAYTTLSPLNAQDMLDTLHELERRHARTIFTLLRNIGLATGPVGVTRLRVYFLGFKNARYQNELSTSEMTDLSSNITSLPSDQQRAIHDYIQSHRSSVTRDLYRGASLPSARTQGRIETIFNPGATTTVSSTGTVTVTLPTPDPVCATPTTLATRIRGVLEPQIRNGASAFRVLQASPPTFPISQATSMADLAQREVESYFRPYLARASRSGAAGTYSLGGGIRASALLGNQATTTRWQNESGRLGWLKYWYDHMTNDMNNTLNCEESHIEAALLLMARDAGLIPDIDAWVNSWPAEATGGINIQPFLNPANMVSQRWDTFTTIIHEFIHILAHPNFRRAIDALPNNAMEILKEGLDDVLRKELWEGDGNLKDRLKSSARASDRAIIEGGTFPLNASLIQNHSYYDNLGDAERITSRVGRRNVKLAYFLGQTEYLGIGTGSTLATGASLAGNSFYDPTHRTEMDHVTVIPGETREQLLLRTNGRNIRDLRDNILGAATPLPPTVRVHGVRHIYVHTDDSLTSIAVQNGVTPYEIMRANNMTSTSLTVGTRILIPRH